MTIPELAKLYILFEANYFVINNYELHNIKWLTKEYDFEHKLDPKSIKATLDLLKSSETALEFKVNNELFGTDPSKAFKDIITFLFMVRLDSPREAFSSFLKRFDKLAPGVPKFQSDVACGFYLSNLARDLTYEDYFNAVAIFKEKDLKSDDNTLDEISKLIDELISSPSFSMQPSQV